MAFVAKRHTYAGTPQPVDQRYPVSTNSTDVKGKKETQRMDQQASQRPRSLQGSTLKTPKRHVTFGPYLIGSTLGEGEFGKVKLGWTRVPPHANAVSKQIAIKLIRKDSISDDKEKQTKVYREINALKHLKHPNIVRLEEVLQNTKYIGIVLEFASGGEFYKYIQKERRLKEPVASKLFAQLLSGVNYMHSKGLVHRDLKLENLLLDKNGNLIITDFGFVNEYTPQNQLMKTSCGSPCYAAPELVVSTRPYEGCKADIWSCGVILYSMLAGYLPWDDDPSNPNGDDIGRLYRYITSSPLKFPDYITPVPRDLLRQMLVSDPRRRLVMSQIQLHEWLSHYRSFLSIRTEEWDQIVKDDDPREMKAQFLSRRTTSATGVPTVITNKRLSLPRTKEVDRKPNILMKDHFKISSSPTFSRENRHSVVGYSNSQSYQPPGPDTHHVQNRIHFDSSASNALHNATNVSNVSINRPGSPSEVHGHNGTSNLIGNLHGDNFSQNVSNYPTRSITKDVAENIQRRQLQINHGKPRPVSYFPVLSRTEFDDDTFDESWVYSANDKVPSRGKGAVISLQSHAEHINKPLYELTVPKRADLSDIKATSADPFPSVTSDLRDITLSSAETNSSSLDIEAREINTHEHDKTRKKRFSLLSLYSSRNSSKATIDSRSRHSSAAQQRQVSASQVTTSKLQNSSRMQESSIPVQTQDTLRQEKEVKRQSTAKRVFDFFKRRSTRM